ncbi:MULTISPECIES: hypothetical protein [Flavobacteriaceae]|uniref:hypothetical protein n=1 Tax=Flavobacteriaceae TaxID=49546 RepID=UPI001358172D|nr:MULTISPECIES: hypothetical protein [Flavobacteriaceae]MBD3892229.1 hypothetical protein [Olleya marilimosa]
MIIKKTAFGNSQEAFIEDRFKNTTNIIFSNDNNRGKTLVIQGLMHSIGYDSIFPSGFNYKSYFFYSNIIINQISYEFLRKGNSIILLENDILNVFNSISEFKYYFDKYIYTLPKIEKDGELKPVDLTLFYELFFLGQDKRNSSNLIIKGRNNKQDFKNMIFAMQNVLISSTNKYDIEELKEQKKSIDLKIKTEKRKITILKKNPEIASFISSTANNIDFKNTSKRLSELHKSIADLQKQRNREENRKIKLENLIIELNSLNRSLHEGKVKCSDCGSSKIIFANQEFEFEVSNNYVRQNILKSIQESISMKKEIVQEFNSEINKEQSQIQKLLKTSTPDVKNYILFQDEIIDSKDIDKIVSELQKQLEEVQKKINNNESKIVSNKDLQKLIMESVISEMMRYYKIIDKDGLLDFEDLFTKSGETYSGSEEQEYYFCKILALNKVLNIEFPIIIDSFREGELSSTKENIMIEEYIKLDNQVILTSTLKDEEYDSAKYLKLENVNVIDYSSFADSQILQDNYVDSFNEILEKFGIKE